MSDIDYQPNLIGSPKNNSGLTPERRNTIQLLEGVLGGAIADRYVDFCKLAFGQHGLQASVPVAAHMLRELDSIFRGALEEFAGEKREPDAAEAAKHDAVREFLVAQGYNADAAGRVTSALAPRDNHKVTIKKIVAWLGFSENSVVAKDWLSVSQAHRMAHERKYNRSLQVDDAFRQKWAAPFDRVIREIALALQTKFAVLVQRVDMLAGETDIEQALLEFDKQNIGASSVQRHFFAKIQGPAWLSKLIDRKMTAEPVDGPPDENGDPTFRDWPIGLYLLSIVDSDDPDTLQLLSDVIQSVAGSENPAVRRIGSTVIAKLRTDHAASLVGVIVGWLPGGDHGVSSSAVDLLRRLAADGMNDPTMELAMTLFDVVDVNGQIGSAFPQYMYEHHLLTAHTVLTDVLGLDALKLYVGMLYKVAVIEQKIRFEPYRDFTSIIIAPLSSDDRGAHDIYGALTEATIKCAIRLMEREDAKADEILDALLEKRCRLTERIAMLALARKPQAARERAEHFLLEPDFLEADNMRHEYADLATAWFPHMPQERQTELLSKIDSIPAKYIDGYRKRLADYEKREATADDDARFVQVVIRDATWYWRSVLPEDRQIALAQTVEKWGDPDAWMRHTINPPDESPMDPADFKASSPEEIARFLAKTPNTDGKNQQADSALLRHFRSAVESEPARLSAGAMYFSTLNPPYLQRLFEGLRSAAQNKTEIDWDEIFALVRAILPQIAASSASAAMASGLLSLAKEIGQFISAGLRSGGENIPLHHAEIVLETFLAFERIVPSDPEIGHLDNQFDGVPYSTAQQTFLGTITDLHFLRLYWLSKHPASPISTDQRAALGKAPEFSDFAERALRFDGNNGLIVRAIFGRYLNWLVYFREAWVKENINLLFPDSERLADAAWSSHLLYDNGPAKPLMHEMALLYRREIAALAIKDEAGRAHRPERLGDYLLILYLTGAIEDGLIHTLWDAAPPTLLKHMIWFLGRELRRADLPPEVRARGEAYWEARISAAEAASNKDNFRQEIGAIGGWMLDSGIPPEWLLSQMLRSLDAGFAPDNTYSVMEWITKNLSEHTDAIVRLVEAMVSNPHLENWAFTGQDISIRGVIAAGRASLSDTTRSRSQTIISIMATKGNTGFLDLMDGALNA